MVTSLQITLGKTKLYGYVEKLSLNLRENTYNIQILLIENNGEKVLTIEIIFQL